MKNTAVIIDYGMGNIGSVVNMIRRVGGESIISSDPEVIRTATRLILPGVGAFDNGMNSLARLGLVEAIQDAVMTPGTLLLGICLGMQLMLESSEEGALPGLGLIAGRVRRFGFDNQKTFTSLKVPHMGWNQVEVIRESQILRKQEQEEKRFYFVHSYYVECDDEDDIIGKTFHGNEFVSAFERDNLIGVQFHPEKSHKFGMKLFNQFLGGS